MKKKKIIVFDWRIDSSSVYICCRSSKRYTIYLDVFGQIEPPPPPLLQSLQAGVPVPESRRWYYLIFLVCTIRRRPRFIRERESPTPSNNLAISAKRFSFSCLFFVFCSTSTTRCSCLFHPHDKFFEFFLSLSLWTLKIHGFFFFIYFCEVDTSIAEALLISRSRGFFWKVNQISRAMTFFFIFCKLFFLFLLNWLNFIKKVKRSPVITVMKKQKKKIKSSQKPFFSRREP